MFQELREGIAANLGDIAGLQESAYVLASTTFPAAQVSPDEIDYDKTFQRGLDAYRFRVMVLVGSVSDIGAQKRLDGFLDPEGATSVKEAVESDKTLGGAAEDLRVTKCSGYRMYERDKGSPPALGAEWTVEVWAAGDGS